MKITCHSCAAKYTVSDEKVQGKTVKMKCRRCGATIVVGAAVQGDHAEESAALQNAPQEGAADGPPPGSFLVSISDNDQRTMTLAEVVEAYNSGVITAETYVFTDGMADWQALAENEAIVAALNEAAQATAGFSGNGTAAAAAPAPYAASTPMMPASAPGYSAYGSAPASSPPMGMDSSSGRQGIADQKPAAARRDSSRKSADLFGGGTDSSAGYASSGALAASSSLSGSTGKREENSVLFSLNALTAAAPAPAARTSVSATTATKEDSGLIDLKALSANAPPQHAPTQAAAPVIDTVGLFPLGAPVIAPAPAPGYAGVGYAGPAPEPKSSSKIGLVIGGVIAVCAVIGVFVLVSGKNDSTNASAAATTAPPTASATAAGIPTTPVTAATSAALASGTDSATAGPDASGSASASATVKVAHGPYTGRKPPPKDGGNTTTTTQTAKPAGALPCGCKAGDVDCAIKCSMKKK